MSKTEEVLMEENAKLRKRNDKLETYLKKTINSLAKVERALEREKDSLTGTLDEINSDLSKLKVMTNSLNSAVNRAFTTRRKKIELDMDRVKIIKEELLDIIH